MSGMIVEKLQHKSSFMQAVLLAGACCCQQRSLLHADMNHFKTSQHV
jgi:hypothetical protein